MWVHKAICFFSLYLCPYMLLISRRVITRVWKIARCQLPLLENEVSARPLNETYFYSMQIKPILTRKALHKTSFPNWWIFELGNAQMEMEIAIQRRRKISTKRSDYREKGSWVNWISIQIKQYNCRKFDKVDLPLKHTIACLIIFTKRKPQTALTEGLALVRERALRRKIFAFRTCLERKGFSSRPLLQTGFQQPRIRIACIIDQSTKSSHATITSVNLWEKNNKFLFFCSLCSDETFCDDKSLSWEFSAIHKSNHR